MSNKAQSNGLPLVDGNIDKTLESFEKELIQNALRLNGNNYSKAAGALGRSRSWIYKRMHKLGLE